MAKLFGVCTPAQYEIIHARWQRISRFGFVPFVLLGEGACLLLISAYMVVGMWLPLRAHHIKYSFQYSWPSEPKTLALGAIMLVLTLMLPPAYWFAMKRHVTRYQRQFGNLPSDHHS